jgi:hypothetical protein
LKTYKTQFGTEFPSSPHSRNTNFFEQNLSRAMLQKRLIIIVISDYERNLKTSTSGNAMLQEFSEITRSSRKTN